MYILMPIVEGEMDLDPFSADLYISLTGCRDSEVPMLIFNTRK